MQIQKDALLKNLETFRNINLINNEEVKQITSIFESNFPFSDVAEKSESIHIHIRVDSVWTLPHKQIKDAGGIEENAKDGYIKYVFDGGANFIFSSINVAQEDLIAEIPKKQRPYVDHLGLDLRQESEENKTLFNSVQKRTDDLKWGYAHQGGDGKMVFCCHTQVSEKHWTYPSKESEYPIIEFAYGPLVIEQGKSGCDLRPADPEIPFKPSAGACGAPSANSGTDVKTETKEHPSSTYYYPGDLVRFGEVGKYNKELMDKFFDYYGSVTATDGALTKKEKSLIVLAVAHAKQCPYCIDAYTTTCLDNGSTPEQMTEAVHVAAAMEAGITLVHAVQMHNAMKKKDIY